MSKEKETKAQDEEKKITSGDVKATLYKAFGHNCQPREFPGLIHLMNKGYPFEVCTKLMDEMPYDYSLELIDGAVALWEATKGLKEQPFDKLLTGGYNTHLKPHNYLVLASAIKIGVPVGILIKIVQAHYDESELLEATIEVAKTVTEKQMDGELLRILPYCGSVAVLKACLKLYQRGEMLCEIQAILVKYEYSDVSQLESLNRHIWARKMSGSIRDVFNFIG